MKKSTLLFALYTFISLTRLTAQNYSTTTIPDSLKENAHSVLRDYTRQIELNSINSGIEKVKKVYTILDKDGEQDASLVISYDKNSKANIQQIILYDGAGKKIRKVKDVEIVDAPAYSEALFADTRIIYFTPNFSAFPYTVEYLYEVEFKNRISFGRWLPLADYSQSTQHALLTLTYPKELTINQKSVRIESKPSPRTDDRTALSWEINNSKTIEEEPLSTSLFDKIPYVILMPNELIWNNSKGMANSWQAYGKWANDLYIGRDELSEAEKVKVTQLISNIPDTIERIKALYSYMQNRTRYAYVQIDIGGFQPFDAKTVYETGYGDCKALSNYMHALLKYIGIQSHPALVASGRIIKPLLSDFPNFNHFDHVILCVPNARDTLWLECTSQVSPFAFLGDFTDDRDVLLLTPEGGKIAHTTKYGINDNLRSSNTAILIDSLGTATVNAKTSYQGLQYHELSGFLNDNSDEQKKWLYKTTQLPSPQISNFTVENTKSRVPIATITQTTISRNYGAFSGNYMLVPINRINIQEPITKMLKQRLSEVVINRSSTDYDTLTFHIPINYKIESIPVGKTIESKFGLLSYTITSSENQIIYTRKSTLIQGRYKPQEYKELYEFVLAVAKADAIKLMLAKKQ